MEKGTDPRRADVIRELAVDFAFYAAGTSDKSFLETPLTFTGRGVVERTARILKELAPEFSSGKDREAYFQTFNQAVLQEVASEFAGQPAVLKRAEELLKEVPAAERQATSEKLAQFYSGRLDRILDRVQATKAEEAPAKSSEATLRQQAEAAQDKLVFVRHGGRPASVEGIKKAFAPRTHGS